MRNPTQAFGPYESDDQAFRDTVEVYAGASPAQMTERNQARLLAVCAAAGVVLGDFDRHIVEWFAQFEPATVQVFVGVISRAGGTR
jgi:hypothetical protein